MTYMGYQTRFHNDKTAELALEAGSLVFTSSYDAALVAAMKGTIPYTERRWDAERKAWLVAPKHAGLLVNLCAQYLGVQVAAPAVYATQRKEIRILDVRYVGATKERQGFDERTATGHCGGEWSVIFPESVLLLWFTGVVNRVEATTLYGILGVSRNIDQDEIKPAFRRLARQWHPDVCREPDAREIFIKIKDAYDVLGDETKRARYDAGLALEATLKQEAKLDNLGYRSPLRCGYVQAEGTEQVGRFVVSRIYGWEEITNSSGQTLVTTWAMGDRMYQEKWL